MVAELGGGDVVNANRDAAGPWETFRLHDLNDGLLMSGDTVTFLTNSGVYYLQAEQGGGLRMLAIGQQEGVWERFILDRTGGGQIVNGNQITIRTIETAPIWYTVAEQRGGFEVNVNRTAADLWETFTIVIQ
jgi:hypothetical protein